MDELRTGLKTYTTYSQPWDCDSTEMAKVPSTHVNMKQTRLQNTSNIHTVQQFLPEWLREASTDHGTGRRAAPDLALHETGVLPANVVMATGRGARRNSNCRRVADRRKLLAADPILIDGGEMLPFQLNEAWLWI